MTYEENEVVKGLVLDEMDQTFLSAVEEQEILCAKCFRESDDDNVMLCDGARMYIDIPAIERYKVLKVRYDFCTKRVKKNRAEELERRRIESMKKSFIPSVFFTTRKDDIAKHVFELDEQGVLHNGRKLAVARAFCLDDHYSSELFMLLAAGAVKSGLSVKSIMWSVYAGSCVDWWDVPVELGPRVDLLLLHRVDFWTPSARVLEYIKEVALLREINGKPTWYTYGQNWAPKTPASTRWKEFVQSVATERGFYDES